MFSPIAFTLGPYHQTSYHALLGQPTLIFREEVGFHPWQTYEWEEEDFDLRQPRVTALYSPWQLIYLNRALRLRSFLVPAGDLADAESLRRLSAMAHKQAEVRLQTLGEHDADWRQLMLLLVRLQNRYWPYVGTYTEPIEPKTLRRVDPLARERRRFRARRALQEMGLTADAVRRYYERLAFFLQSEDPIPAWWVLRRVASTYERERFKGPARRVEDLWDAAQVLRLYYRTLTRKVLPDCDAVGVDPAWHRHVLGHEPRLYYDQEDLRRFLIRHDLYPNQVHVFVEGDSEEVMLTILIEDHFSSLGQAGIQLTNLRGVDNVSARHREFLEGFTRYARAAVLIADNEGEIARYIAAMVREKLINPQGVLLWKKNLEEDNFSDGQLVAAARAIAMDKGAKLRGITGQSVRESFERRRQLPQNAPATFVEELLRLAAHPDHGSIRFSKPELAKKLSERILAELAKERWGTVAKRRPILGRFEVIAQLAHGARFASSGPDG